MKAVCIIFAFCAILCSSVDAVGDDPAFAEAMTKCVQNSGIDGQIITDIFTKLDAKSDDPKVRCLFKCFTEELKWMDKATGEFLLDGPWYDLDEAIINVVKECAAAAKDPEPCDKAYHFNKCLVEKKLQN